MDHDHYTSLHQLEILTETCHFLPQTSTAKITLRDGHKKLLIVVEYVLKSTSKNTATFMISPSSQHSCMRFNFKLLQVCQDRAEIGGKKVYMLIYSMRVQYVKVNQLDFYGVQVNIPGIPTLKCVNFTVALFVH